MNIPVEDQETVVQYDRTSKKMTIYTTDSTTMTRLDKIYRSVKFDVVDGKVVAKTYEADKRLLSFRKDAGFKPEYQPKRKVNKENLDKMLACRR